MEDLYQPLQDQSMQPPQGLNYQYDVQDEIDFWAPRMREHMIFYNLLLADTNEAKLYKQASQDLLDRWDSYLGGNNEEDLNELVNDTLNFKESVLEAVRSQGPNQSWLGTIYESFVLHTILEGEYFFDRINGLPVTIDEEAAFWTKDGSDHALLTAKMIDPSQDVKDFSNGMMSPLSDTAKTQGLELLNLVQDFQNLDYEDSNDYMDSVREFTFLSQEKNLELDQFNKQLASMQQSGNLSSVIHPLLLQHIIAEGERGKIVLNRIEKQISPSINM